jgi:subtilase family serine protease
MTRKPLAFPALSAVFLFLCVAAPSFGQTANVQSRIALPIDDSSLVTLHGNTHPYATAKFDQGAVDSSLTMHRMLLLLQRSPAQESALEELLQEQQDKTSPNFHQWLTPEQFGAQFGPSQQDIQTISLWLQSHGFQVNSVAKGGILIDFTGTAAQVEQTFHTPIHKYQVQGTQYYANSQDPQIPTALSAVVAGIRSLHNFPARALNHSAGTFRRDPDTGEIHPVGKLPIAQFTFPSADGCGLNGGLCEALGPFDLATIYNVSPLWNASTPIDGTGEIIAISGETDINPADWTSFWAMFGVTAPKGKLNIIVDGPDPGVQGDEPEADIDTQWSSAVARGATIDYVETEATEATLGVDLSDEYIVDNNLAGVMSESYGICELFIGTSGNTFYNTLWQQASAQGITVFISSGDQGSAVCDSGQEYAQNGLAVNGFGSTPYNVSVGGTDFNDGTTASKYWNTTNNTTNFSNAKGYIPEETWNNSCTNSEIFPLASVTSAEQSCNNAEVQDNKLLVVVGGSGGASNCTTSTGTTAASCSGGYPRPSWQIGGSGLSSDGKRDVPDVSLFASNGFNGSFYIICQSDAAPDACSLSGNFQGYGGTSVASPAFAGIMALIEQKTGERQGNANYVFYKMANAGSNSCNSNSPTSSCVFYDIPSGSTIAMPCATGSPNCTTKTAGDPYGVLSGFATTSGYDQATGLGSVNVTNLVNGWSTYSGAFKGSKFSAFTMGPPTTITHGQPMPVAATVVPQSGSGTPTGSIVLITNTGSTSSGELTTPQTLALANGSLASGTTTDFLPGGTAYTVTAHYSGDGTYAPADSSPVTVTVNPESSKLTTGLITYNPQNGAVTGTGLTTVTFGVPYLMRTDVTNSGGTLCATNDIVNYGCPSGTLTVNDTYNGSTGTLDGGSFPLNTEAYAEDQNILLQGGQHSIAISYGGDKSYNASSTTATITVNKAATTISLSSAQSFTTVGSNASFAASINASVLLPYNAPNSDFPADNVQFLDSGTPITGVVTYQTAAQTEGGPLVTATFSTTALKPGNHTITAQFTGDSNYSASTVSNSVTTDIQISTAGSTLTASSATIQHGASETLTYTVVPSQTGGPAPTGTVQFTCYCGGAGLSFVAPVTNGQVQWVTSVLPGGSDQISASYGGDSNYQNSAENTSVTVTLLGSATSVSTSNASISSGTSVTLSATVAASKSGGPAPTGTVQFSAGTNSSGGSTTLGSAVPVASGAASLTTTAIPAGTQYVFASYSGDSNYSPSTASTAEVVTGAASFTVAAAPASIAISKPGASGSTTLTFAASGNYTGTITLSSTQCSGLPAESTCSFGTTPLILNGNGSIAQSALIIQTTAASAAPASMLARPNRPWPLAAIAFAAMLIGFLGATYVRAFRFAPRSRAAALAVLTVALLLTFTSCGGGGGTTNPGTPAGSYTVTVSISGAGVTPAPSTTIALTVQ